MCGSTELLKQDGVFVCQNCGTKYSVEEARKMMVEGTVEVAGTVKVDNSASLENYLKIAKTAYSSANQVEAERYANKVIEIAPDNYEAWLIKGKSAGWQSTLANPRFPECISAFSAALINTPDDEKESVGEDIKEEIKNISCALITLRAERFVKWPDKEEAIGFIGDITTIIKAVSGFLANGIAISISNIMAPAAELINESVNNAYKNTIYPDYKSKEYPYPTDRDLAKYIERIGYCIKLVENSIKLCDEDNKADIKRYERLIELQEYLLDARSYDWHSPSVELNSSNASFYTSKGYHVDIYNNRVYYVKSTLNDSAAATCRSKISEYKSKISEIKEEIKEENDRSYNEFWDINSEEEELLLNDLDKCQTERNKLNETKTGFAKIKLINGRIAEIESILDKERGKDSQLTKAEKDFIKGCKAFWAKLSSNDKYDAYLDQNPILKQADSLAEKREELLAQKSEVESAKKPRFSPNFAPFLFCTILGVIIISIGACLLSLGGSPFYLVLGILCTGGCGIGVGVCVKKHSDLVAEARSKEEAYNKELREYNATIDKMKAVPKYEGSVNSDVEVKIPEKIREW